MEDSKKLELKVQALLEKISSLTMDYENQVANLRVEITTLAEELQNTQVELASAVERLRAASDAGGVDEVPQEEASDEG